MLERAWRKSAYERNLMFYNLAFSRAKANRNLKPNPYLADTVKHLIMIAAGTVTGFGAAVEDSDAPISLLQKVYMESYGLKEYFPTLFVPKHFSLQETKDTAYYSLSWPTTLEFSPKSRKESSILQDLAELRHIILTFIDEVKNNKLKIEDTIIGNIANSINFEFYHSKPDKHGEIKLSNEMIKEDVRLMKSSNNIDQRHFADSGTFVRGCVRINNASMI